MDGENDAGSDAERKFEQRYVQQVYDSIAVHFSSTRYKRWPVVERFLCALPAGSVGVDLGCGNGKNLAKLCCHDELPIMTIGMDSCVNLLNICADERQQQCELFAGDVLSLPLKRDSFDFAMSIAVIHHLRTPARRMQAIQEMLRVLVKGGTFLIFVWAMEPSGNADPAGDGGEKAQERTAARGKVASSVYRHQLQFITEGNQQDVLVPWNTKTAAKPKTKGEGPSAEQQHDEDNVATTTTFLRYYHLFKQGELDDLVVDSAAHGAADGVPCRAHIVESGYDRDNWFVIGTKL